MEIKETKELVKGFLKLSVLLAEAFKDGAQASDVLQVVEKIKAQPELLEEMKAMYNGVEQVPAELKDLTMVEGFELLTAALPEVTALVKVLKTPKAV